MFANSFAHRKAARRRLFCNSTTRKTLERYAYTQLRAPAALAASVLPYELAWCAGEAVNVALASSIWFLLGANKISNADRAAKAGVVNVAVAIIDQVADIEDVKIHLARSRMRAI